MCDRRFQLEADGVLGEVSESGLQWTQLSLSPAVFSEP